jgi:hypothetical protein
VRLNAACFCKRANAVMLALSINLPASGNFIVASIGRSVSKEIGCQTALMQILSDALDEQQVSATVTGDDKWP